MKTIYTALLAAIMIGFSGCDGGASTENPTITLKGDSNIVLEKGQVIDIPKYSASDTKDGDLTRQVKVTSNINFYKVGDYYVNYQVIDSDGNQATAARTVQIVERGTVGSGDLYNGGNASPHDGVVYDIAKYRFNNSLFYDGKTIKQTVKKYTSGSNQTENITVLYQRNKKFYKFYEFHNNNIQDTYNVGPNAIEDIDASTNSSLAYNRFAQIGETFLQDTQNGTTMSCTLKEHFGNGGEERFYTDSVDPSLDRYDYGDVLHIACEADNGYFEDVYYDDAYGEFLRIVSSNGTTEYFLLDKNSMQEVN